ncbi:Thymus-specific serine protease [Plasmodiophora brassicae]
MAPVGDKVIRRTYPTMTMALLAALALSSLASASMTGPLGVNPRARSFYSYLRQVHPHRYSSSEPGDVDANLPEERWFPDQQVDHFNGENTQTFAQRYFVNDTFWDRQKGPVFLYIGGEGALSPRDAYAGHHMELAEKFHALVIAIEHRFYGKTFPSSDLSTKNLRHLSSAQALADIATFIAHARAKFGFGNAPLISFGGSYSGALSAWFRIKYPHLVFAAVASSAPVHALTDFYQYNDVVGRSLAAAVVGGSEHCKERVKSGFVHLDDMLDKGLYEEASAAFRSCSPVTTSDDAVQLVSDLAGIFEGTVQYNNQMSLNVERICSIMTDPETSPFEALQKLNDHVLDSTETECADYSAESMIHQLANATIIDDGPVGMRQWLYQTCTQFGYYQTCEGRNCIFSKRMTLRSNTDLCSALFGVDLDNLDARIDFSNDDYGADRPAGSRILFVNGVIDPWHALSVLKDATSGVDESAFVMRSTSHCQNMHGSNPDDSEELRQGRMFIERKVASWLYDAQRPLVSSS